LNYEGILRIVDLAKTGVDDLKIDSSRPSEVDW